MVTFRNPFPIFTTRDLPATRAFYRDMLGFQEGYQFPEGSDPVFISFKLGEAEVAFARSEDVLAPGTAVPFELCMYTDDVDAAIEMLRSRGVPILQEPADQPWGERMAYAADPNGYRIHIAAVIA